MVLWIAALLFVTAAGVGLRFLLRERRRRRIARRRRVEEPNSHYSAPGVRRLADLERWGGIRLDQLHPLNRDEVRRLLRLARGAGSDILALKERQFLDNMARLDRAESGSGESLAAPQPQTWRGPDETPVPHAPAPANAPGEQRADPSRS